MPSALDLLLSQLRRDLEREEGPLRSQMILAYESAIYDLEHDLFNVTWLIEDAQARGIDITPDWLYRQDRYKRLIARAEEQMARFSQQALPIIEQTNLRGARLGTMHGPSLLEAAGIRASFGTGINTQAVDILMQNMFRAGPIRDVLDSYGGNTTAAIRHHMAQGVIQGLSPREVVRNITRDLASGTNRARLSTLVRTEHMRAYRLSQAQTLEEYSHAIKGYRWSAALQMRTCFACLARDGEIYDEPQYTMHPNCRCICTPIGYFTPEKYKRQTGAEWFASQPADVQRKMMPSQAAYDAYKRGDIQLSDFVGERHSETWGTSVYQLSGKEAMARAGVGSPGSGGDSAPDIPRFMPAETIQDAEDFARGLGISNVKYGDGSQLHVANMVNEGLSDMKSRGATMPRTVGVGKFTKKSERGVVARYSAKNDSLEWNPKNPMWNDIDGVVKKQYESGFFSTDNPAHMIRHEMGHALDAKANPQWYDTDPLNFQRREAAWLADDNPNVSYLNGYIRRHVSGYSLKKNDEFIAEVFAGRMDGIDYPSDILEWYREMKGPEIDFPVPTKPTPWGER